LEWLGINGHALLTHNEVSLTLLFEKLKFTPDQNHQISKVFMNIEEKRASILKSPADVSSGEVLVCACLTFGFFRCWNALTRSIILGTR
jgi:hypothetical protein